MDTYKGNPSYQKPVLSNPTGAFHLFFQYQAQIQSCFFLKTASLLFPLGMALLRICKCQTIWFRDVVLIRYLENRAAFDFVPTYVYESNYRYHNNQNFIVFPKLLKAHSPSASVHLPNSCCAALGRRHQASLTQPRLTLRTTRAPRPRVETAQAQFGRRGVVHGPPLRVLVTFSVQKARLGPETGGGVYSASISANCSDHKNSMAHQMGP